MLLLLGSFIAGALTVLAPCVLPLLPVIIGGSVTGHPADRRRPLIITVSLAVSLIAFTLLLKVSTLLINVPPTVITDVAGGIIVLLGILMFLPDLYARFMAATGFEQSSQTALAEAPKNRGQLTSAIVTGAALGPVFSSCSPIYAYILATVLPAHIGAAMAYMLAYVIGLSLVLLLVGYYGRRFTGRIKFAANPRGWFQRTVAVIFIIVGVLVITGYDQKFQTFVSDHTPFNFDALSQEFIPKSSHPATSTNALFNVAPYAAPELTGITGWINSQPLTLKQLQGKVVLVDFWTYSCINCIRNNVYLEKWYQAYQGDGLVIIGVSAPEFSFEKVLANVQKGVTEQHLTYPVALDSDLKTWNAFQNASWPSSYLINPAGQVVRLHEGEGDYQESEEAIRQLLTANGAHLGAMTTTGQEVVPITQNQTPETYLGYSRAAGYFGTPALGSQPVQTYTAPGTLGTGSWALGGSWEVQGDQIIARGHSTLSFHVAAKDVYLVGGSPAPASIGITINGQPLSATSDAGADTVGGKLPISTSQLYRLVSFPGFTSGQTIELSVPDGVTLNTFTFGS